MIMIIGIQINCWPFNRYACIDELGNRKEYLKHPPRITHLCDYWKPFPKDLFQIPEYEDSTYDLKDVLVAVAMDNLLCSKTSKKIEG